MSLKLLNTLTGRKEEFTPLHPPKVTLYVCGVTVYDDCHIGHARGAVVFDLLRRYLTYQKFQVTYVRNITDVDDKIIDRARTKASAAGASLDLKNACLEIAQRYETSFRDDFNRLSLAAPDHEPKATEYIPQMIDFIRTLLEQGMAYEGSDGVYFSVRKIQHYGKLSHQSLDEMKIGVRSEPGEGKADPLDFALWKKAKDPIEPAWESPWGAGRPGWHIECSTMSTALLGNTFDIHGGGQDLIFPHHENEIAQAEGAGKSFAQMWLHNGLLTVGGQKMSKSLGNFVTIGEALKKHSANVVRLFFLSAHYRSPQDFTWERFDEAAHAYERIIDFMSQVEQLLKDGTLEQSEIAKTAEEKFHAAMEDDLNTPEALAALYELVTKAGAWFSDALQGDEPSRGKLRCAAKAIRELSAILGITIPCESELPEEILRLREERDHARQKKDFEKADQIRRQAKQSGFIMADTGGGTVVRPDV